jgi:hydroxyacylglutathione hydrolase
MMKSDDTFDLKDFGCDRLVRRTGGHTPGSIAVELASQEALVGDLIAAEILIGGIAFTRRAMRLEDTPMRLPGLQRMVEGRVQHSTWAIAVPCERPR